MGENRDETTRANAFFLGGLGRLSGSGRDEQFGDLMALARVLHPRRPVRRDIGSLRVRACAGLSLELGHVSDVGAPASLDALTAGGGPFVAALTPIGPLSFRYGLAEC